MNHNGNRIRKGITSREDAGKDSQDLEIECLGGNEGEGRVQGNSKILTFAAWDNVIDTPGEDEGELFGQQNHAQKA